MVSPDCFHNFPFSFGSLMRLIFIYLKFKKNHCLYFGLVLLLHAGLWLRQAGAAHLLRSTGTSVLGLGSCVLGSLSRGRGNLAGPGMEPPRWQADP